MFGDAGDDMQIAISDIISTSTKSKLQPEGTLLKIGTKSGELILFWGNEYRINTGIGAFGGGFGGGMSMSNSMNPNVASWLQLIDDLRFGRLKNPDEPPAGHSEEKKCPMCAEMVKAEAKVCRFCHFDFDTKEMPNST
jgi:hypothetical protein